MHVFSLSCIGTTIDLAFMANNLHLHADSCRILGGKTPAPKTPFFNRWKKQWKKQTFIGFIIIHSGEFFSIWVFPKIWENHQIIHLFIGFSIIFTIHFGVQPGNLLTKKVTFGCLGCPSQLAAVRAPKGVEMGEVMVKRHNHLRCGQRWIIDYMDDHCG